MSVLKIVIGSDHAGIETKKYLIDNLKTKYVIIDYGTNSSDSCDYPDIAKSVCEAINKEKENCFGILICGTGIGMSIAANKFKGIRCANVTSVDFAKLAKAHNNANVLSLSGRFVSNRKNLKIINKFINTTFEQRHQKRLNKLNGEKCVK